MGMNLVSNVKWEFVWNFKFRECQGTGNTLYPFTRVWRCTYTNHAGAIVGGPPATCVIYECAFSHTARVISGKLDDPVYKW